MSTESAVSPAGDVYPAYVDGVPPTVTLKEYDFAPWALTTCIDKQNNGYIIVVMQEPEKIVAKVDKNDYETLDTIFQSAHKDYSEQLVEKGKQ